MVKKYDWSRFERVKKSIFYVAAFQFNYFTILLSAGQYYKTFTTVNSTKLVCSSLEDIFNRV
jgi:hypothetical protein